ncbi:MAG: hypothetical protein KC620_09350, partial [Myxococcales bacterium]|nr:hypothetical protein [Myxococcales bacterium]
LTLREMPGAETVTGTVLEAAFGPPHPATRTVVIGNAAPLGRHWTWTLTGKPGALFIAEVRPDDAVRYHFAEVGRIVGGSNSAGFFSECLIERYGTPGW